MERLGFKSLVMKVFCWGFGIPNWVPKSSPIPPFEDERAGVPTVLSVR